MIQIIAECGVNYFGDIEIAKELIRQAKECGADYAKFQLYDVAKVFPNKEIITQGKNWYDDVLKTQLTKEQAKILFDYGEEVGIEVFFSVFDIERVKWCEEIGVKRYKFAGTLKESEVIRDVLATNKPVVSSRPYKAQFYPMKMLLCVNKYPATIADYQLGKNKFGGFYDGISDHTIGIEISMIAMSRGARIIEKHFCLSREREGVDIPLSITPNELKQLTDFARKVEQAL